MKRFLTCALTIACIGVLSACNNKEKLEAENRIDFFAITSEITGKEVSVGNVPYYFTIGSDNSFCTIDTNPYDLDDYSASIALGYIQAMNAKLGLPEYVYQEMITTSYSQGKQTETCGKISVVWYYHPDKGMNVTYKIVSD